MKVFELKQKVHHEKFGRGQVINTKNVGSLGLIDFNGVSRWLSISDKSLRFNQNSYEVSVDDVLRVANKHKRLAVKIQQLQSDLMQERKELLAKNDVKDFDLVRADEKKNLIERLELILKGK